MVYHLENTKGFTLKFLQYFVLDEADKLFELDFEEQINQILDECPKNRTTYLYSATMTSKVSIFFFMKFGLFSFLCEN